MNSINTSSKTAQYLLGGGGWASVNFAMNAQGQGRGASSRHGAADLHRDEARWKAISVRGPEGQSLALVAARGGLLFV